MKPCLLLLSSLLFLSPALSAKEASGTESRPNIVFIFSDDHATQAIGAYGHELAKIAPTPHLDRLAANGMRFDRCMVTNSICGPSRATILTGKYSHLNGFYFNEDTEFDGSQVTFPKILQQHGYRTAIIGKWHLGSEPTGFDHWEVLPGQGSYYQPEFRTPDGIIQEPGYVTEVVTDKAIQWLEKERPADQPFLLMVQHKAPHRIWAPPPEDLEAFADLTFPEPDSLFDTYAGRTTAAHVQDMTIAQTLEADKDLKVFARTPGKIFYERVYSKLTPAEKAVWDRVLDRREAEYRNPELKGAALVKWKYQIYLRDYLACVRSLDRNIGRLQEYLESSGISKNTIVVYSSDQGFYLGEHGWFDKRFMYDESYRTPLLVQWLGKVNAGSVNQDLVSNLDFAQTFLEIAGATQDPDMQGQSLLPILLENSTQPFRQYHYYHYYEYPGWHMVPRHEGIYDGRYKLIHFYDLDEWELLDTRSDPQEFQNQYHNPEYANVVVRMTKALGRQKEKYKVPPGIPAPRTETDSWKYLSPQRTLIEQSK
jgi:arylsulfatase A-like enzyme